MNRKVVTDIQDAIVEAVQGVATRFNVSIEKDSGSIGAANATLKFKIIPLDSEGNITLSEFDKRMLVNEINDPSVTFENVEGFTIQDGRGNELTIVGFNTRAPKMPIRLSGGAKCGGGYIRQQIRLGKRVTS